MAWRILLLGTPRVEHNRAMVPIERRKALGLLAYLVVQREMISRETLAALFWPDADKALAYLRTTLWTLNNVLPADWVLTEGGALAFNPDAAIATDYADFHRLIKDGSVQALKDAVALYRDDFLAGFTLPDAPDFDEWRYIQSETLRRGLNGALERLIDAHSGDEAVQYARRWLSLDTLNEAAHRRLMTLYAQEGNIQAAVRQFHEAERLMRDELGVSLEAETLTLYESIRERRIAPAAAVSAAPAPPVTGESPRATAMIANRPAPEPVPSETPVVNLPAQTTPFVGRKHEIAEIKRLMDTPDCRLLTLIGQGGIGKTRLAIEVASRTVFPDGTFFISLAPVRSEEYIVPAITCGIYCDGALKNKDDLLNYLSRQRMLLVLDNFEHLISAADLISEILAAAPDVKLLITSRERLNLQEEWLFEIQGLDYPRRGDTINDIEAFSAIRLFLQAARRARIGYTLAPMDVPALIRICQLVEGMPLGLELAATWMQMLSPLEIAREIKQSLDFLSTPARNVPERHRNLRAVFEYSWTTLQPDEQACLSRLSVFRGDFTLEAARSVADATLHQLLALVNKSLVRRNALGRYEMHELLRQFADSKLTREEYDQLCVRHGEYFTEFLRRSLPALKSREQAQALRAMESVMDDVRGAWSYALANERWEWLWSAVEALFHFSIARDRFVDLAEMYQQAVHKLESAGQPDRLLLGVVLSMFSTIQASIGSRVEVERLVQRALPIVRDEFSGHPGTILPLIQLGQLLNYPVRRRDDSKALLARAVELADQQSDVWLRAIAKVYMAWWYQSNIYYDQSRRAFMEALDLFERIGQPWGIAAALNGLKAHASTLGDLSTTRQLLERMIPLLEPLDNRLWMSGLLIEMNFYTERHNHIELLQKSLKAAIELGNRPEIAWSTYHIAWNKIYVEEQYDEAIHLLEEADLIFREFGDIEGITWGLVYRGVAHMFKGDLVAARALAQEVVDGQPFNKFPWSYAGALYLLGDIALRENNPLVAREYFREAVNAAHKVQSVIQVRRHLVGIAEVLAVEGELEQAYAIAHYMHAFINPLDQDIHERAGALLHRLGPEMTSEQRQNAARRYEGAELDVIVREVLD